MMNLIKLQCCFLLFFSGIILQAQTLDQDLIDPSSEGKIKATKVTLAKIQLPPIAGKPLGANKSAPPAAAKAAAVTPDAGSTPAQASVSPSGAITYTVPIAIPPGIKDVVPSVSLSYSGQAANGLAGYGWNVTGLSTITRIPSTKFHDDEIDGVDFDTSDRYALDGQRLLLKSGAYGAANSEYQTENYSNIKIKAFGTSALGANFGPNYFVVLHPDGTRAWYGLTYSNRVEWAIYRQEDPQGNTINYAYLKSNNLLRINTISYGGGRFATGPNKIQFNYATRVRPEQVYMGGIAHTRKNILTNIEVRAGSALYRKYQITHKNTSLGYSLINSIAESNGKGKSLAPITFNYDTSSDKVMRYKSQGGNVKIFPGVNRQRDQMISGEFSGDGKMDMMLYDRHKRNEIHLFTDITKGINQALAHSLVVPKFSTAFASQILSHTNKLLTQQAITTVSEADTGTTFRTIALGASGIYHQYDKVWKARTYEDKPDCAKDNVLLKKIPRSYISGDFNGDGLTDVLAIEKSYTNTYCYVDSKPDCKIERPFGNVDPECCLCETNNLGGRSIDFIDLNRQKTTNFNSNAGSLSSNRTSTERLIPADYDGDGKTDLLHFTEGKVEVYSMGVNNRLTKVLTLSNAAIKMKYPTLLGDYNGDGKLDFAVPVANKSTSWSFFIGRGTDFSIYTKNIGVWFGENDRNVTGHIFEGEVYTIPYTPLEKLYEYHYSAQDYNGDGKSDILSHHVITPVADNRFSTEKISLHLNRMSSNDPTPYFEPKGYLEEQNNGVRKFGIPISWDLNTRTANLEYGYIDGNNIYGYQFEKDHRKDITLRSVSNNRITTAVTYDSDSNGPISSVYTRGYKQLYPYTDINLLTGLPLVRELKQSGGGVTRSQQFKYHGAVSHAGGLGFIGFSQLHRTNWYGDGVGTLWTSTLHDPQKRGAVTQQWISQGPNSTATGYSSKITNSYATSLTTNKVFINTLRITKEDDVLKGVNSTKYLYYDSYKNPTKIITHFPGGSNTVLHTYSNNVAALDNTYHLGRTTETKETAVLKGSTFSTTQQYKYENNLLIELTKLANDNRSALTYVYDYDSFGNMISKTSPGGRFGLWNFYTYDPSGRYMLSSEDQSLGLKTTFTYNTTFGTLSTTTDPYGAKTAYTYDGWNRQISETNYLGKKTTTKYTRLAHGGIFTEVDYPQGSDQRTWQNIYGWVTKESTLSLKNKWISVSSKYDTAGRAIEVSEPYFTSATQWNKTTYDLYGRPLTQLLPTGRLIKTTYNKLTVSVNDEVKTVSTTTDALGNIASMTDPGGTITYSYFPNGVMKEANYDTHKVTVAIDAWGRKSRMEDPSAGVYTYGYDNVGRILEEKTPKGTTTYRYNEHIGTLQNKTIKGDQTSMNINYSFDKGRPVSISASANDGHRYDYTYDYDTYGRETKVTELISGKHATGDYQRLMSYDNYGRPDLEVYSTKNQQDGTSVNVKVKNVYDPSGILIGIQDLTSNKLLWNLTDENHRGQPLNIALGNGYTKTRKYDTYGNPIEIKDSKAVLGKTTTAMHMTYGFNAKRGIITKRNNHVSATDETFIYDDTLDLLTKVEGSYAMTQTYDKRGNIDSNSRAGKYSYDSQKKYQLKEVDLSSSNFGARQHYHIKQLQQVTYNAFKKPVEILEENLGGRVSLEYGPLMNRTHAYYGNAEKDKQKRRYHKYYSSIIPVEITTDITTNTTKIVTYIGGDGYTAPIAHIKQEGSTKVNAMHYIHRDHLGSIIALTDDKGAVVQQHHYKAWGGAVGRIVGNTNVFASNGGSILDRGFTGHEHFSSVGLIHMNGRMYDPILHRFLSPDNNIQAPFSTQSYNRYGYAWNNPLTLNDISGEWFGIDDLIAGAIGGIINLGVNILQGNIKGNVWEVIGKGAAAFGSGAAAGALALYGPAGWAAGGALVGGTNAWLSGTDVLQGTLFGAASGLVGGQFGKWAGQLGGVLINNLKVTSPVLQGLIGGSVGGALGGGVTNFSMSLVSGANFGDALNAGLQGFQQGFVIGAVAGVGSSYAGARANKLDPFSGQKVEMHHSDPKFMGGDRNQPLTPVGQSTHKQLHRDMNNFLREQTDGFGKHMRPQRGNSGVQIREVFSRPIRVESLKGFYDINRFKYPRSRFDFYKNNNIKWRL